MSTIKRGTTPKTRWQHIVIDHLNKVGLSDEDMPTKKEVYQKVRSREERRPLGDQLDNQPTLIERLSERIVAKFGPEIRARGGEVKIHGEHTSVELTLMDYERGFYLLGADGWRYYSRRAGSRQASLRYLCGTDDTGKWAVRIPGTVQSVEQAVAWITPAKVEKAGSQGKTVKRQGDVYLVETSAAHDGSGDDLPESHEWDETKRKLYHLEPNTRKRHRAVYFPKPVTFVMQRVLAMERDGDARGGFGD